MKSLNRLKLRRRLVLRTMRNQKKNLRKGSWKGQVVQPNGTGWDRLEYVGQVGLGQGALQIRWDSKGLGQVAL